MLDERTRTHTVDAIARVQRADGSIPWFDAGPLDPWNMVEAALALDAAGRHNAARAAFRWLAHRQRGDGAWATGYRDGIVVDPTLDSNFTAYFAVGAWHSFVATRDRSFLEEMWPAVDRALSFVLELQGPGGEIWWARDANGNAWERGLLTGSSCVYLSLRCALATARELGEERPDWELAAGRLATAVARGGDAFQDKSRYSMDWYYPVLCGVLRGDAARRRLAEGWAEFVIEGCGVRCVSDRPWITSGETAEAAIAFAVAGLHAEARALFEWVQDLLRAPTGLYWTGATVPDRTVWPREQTTWSSGAMVLAADVLDLTGPATAIFSGDDLPEVPALDVVPDPLR